MTKYNPNIHNRRSIRLKGYDYSQAGLYFITLCCQNREHLFGEIIDGKMILNEAGEMIDKNYYQLEKNYPFIQCHEMIVMPNHMHFILEREKGQAQGLPPQEEITVGAIPCGSPNKDHPKTIGDIVGAFKSITTVEYIKGVRENGWQEFNKRIWQRNYYEHIIRNEKAYKNISNYILNNPKNWGKDKLN